MATASVRLGYTPANRLGTATGPWGSASYTYDAVGNRPLAVARNAVVHASYEYDAKEQLVSRNTSAPGGPTGAVHYVHDLAGHVIAEADGATGATTREYIWLRVCPGRDR